MKSLKAASMMAVFVLGCAYGPLSANALSSTSALHGADQWGGALARGNSYHVSSPDRQVVVEFVLQDGGRPAYAVRYRDHPVVEPSRLGFPAFESGFEVVDVATGSHEGEWINELGERRVVPDRYREMHVDLRHDSGRQMRVTFRAYDEGAALRYSFPEQQDTRTFRFSGESTEFRFPANTYGYEEHGTEGPYRRVPTDSIRPFTERPLTLRYASGIYASLTEAGNLGYARMLLSPLEGVPGALVSALGGRTSNTERESHPHAPDVTLAAGESTPWRAFIVGERPGDLLERNYLVLNLSPPSRVADASWIRPGKAMRETTLSTLGGKATVDFAVQHGLQYVLFDAGWYGPENDAAADATTVTLDPQRAGANHPGLDLPEVIRYANERGIGVFLYVNRRALERQLEEILPLYRSWGVRGLKFGFVQVGPQEWTKWVHHAVARAAEHGLLVDIHDGYRPTGISRTYPNLLTQEGVRGNEHMPTAEHNVTLPFTRYLAGAADYTICYYTDRIKTTHAHQLALSVVMFSPLQLLFWYDRPSAYQGEPEIEFFEHVPTVWDETRVVTGEIGDHVTVARRSGEEWYVGSLTDENARELDVPLDFLKPGRHYVAHVYGDGGPEVPTRTRVSIERFVVDRGTVLRTRLIPTGGQAVRIVPATTADLDRLTRYGSDD